MVRKLMFKRKPRKISPKQTRKNKRNSAAAEHGEKENETTDLHK
jgi:hypothetical protein